MSDFRIDIEQVPIRRGLAGRAIERLVRKITARMDAQAYVGAPKASGNMAHGMTAEIVGSGSSAQGVLKAVAKTADGKSYPLFVHEGTGLYGPEKRSFFIEAKNKKALAIPLQGPVQPGQKGLVMFRRSVHILGMKARPWYRWAAAKIVQEVPNLARKAFAEIFGGGGSSAGGGE